MPLTDDVPYALGGDSFSDQAQQSTRNRGAATLQMRILVELQVISNLLANNLGTASEGLRQMRQDIADSIT